jgi:hypothetical protein
MRDASAAAGWSPNEPAKNNLVCPAQMLKHRRTAFHSIEQIA